MKENGKTESFTVRGSILARKETQGKVGTETILWRELGEEACCCDFRLRPKNGENVWAYHPISLLLFGQREHMWQGRWSIATI